jgi:hypothetical protein
MRPRWICARAGSTPAAYPHTGVEAGGGWSEKRKGRRRWLRGRRSPETRARDAAALLEEGDGSSGRICSCDAHGVGVQGHGSAEERRGRGVEISQEGKKRRMSG